MKNNNKISPETSRAIENFIQKLPNPGSCMESTITDHFLIADKKVTVKAQKKKGTKGMFWSVEYQE